MTAPDPTAGEPEWVSDLRPDVAGAWRRERCAQFHDGHPCGVCDASPPAVAASTGTGEDVEALRAIIEPATDVDGYEAARAVLASGWLAAREAAARAEVVAGVRAWCAINETAAPPLDWEGLGEFLARIAREVRP